MVRRGMTATRRHTSTSTSTSVGGVLRRRAREVAGRWWGAGLPGTGPGAVADPAWAPASVEVAPRYLRVGEEWVATLVVAGYPGEVDPGWLEPLLSYPGRLDVSVHITPVPAAVAAQRLQRQRARLESGRRHTADKERLEDPEVDAAAEDAAELAARIARGEGKLFEVALLITVHAMDEDHLADEVAALRALCDSMLLRAHPTTFRSLQGWIATLPLALDAVGMTRTFDTTPLAAGFPFISAELSGDPVTAATPTGTFVGTSGTGVVMPDRWAADNHNLICLGYSGSGKSYTIKLDLLRHLYTGVQAQVIDPEDEYTALATAVGGTIIRLGEAGVRINPFDLPPVPARSRSSSASGEVAGDGLTRRALWLHTFLAVLLGETTPGEKAVLDRAILATYHRAGITADPRTWTRPAPLLADLAEVLADAGAGTGGRRGSPIAAELAERLSPYTSGSHAGLFSGPSTVRIDPDTHLVVHSLRGVPEELRAVCTLLTLDMIWRQVSDPHQRQPRMVYVDEAWLMLNDGDGAAFLARLAKSARKYWAGLVLATQDVGDVLGSELGKVVIANCATQLLMRQAPQAIAAVADAFHLSTGERNYLLTAQPGEGLMTVGRQRAAFRAIASPAEHELITTRPAELAHRRPPSDAFYGSAAPRFTDSGPGGGRRDPFDDDPYGFGAAADGFLDGAESADAADPVLDGWPEDRWAADAGFDDAWPADDDAGGGEQG